MAHAQTTVRIHRPADVVFESIVQHARTNEPAWEPEVLGVEPLDAAPLRVGSRVAMTRRDGGRTHTTTYEITALEAPRRLAIRHVDGPMEFFLEFTVVPAGGAETDVTAAVEMSPKGKLKILAPVFALSGPSRNKRITMAMAKAIEASTPPASSGELAPA